MWTAPIFLTKGHTRRFWRLVKNIGAGHAYKPSAWAVTRSVPQHPTKISGLKITQKITMSLIAWFTHWSWEPGRYVVLEGRFRTFWNSGILKSDIYSTHANLKSGSRRTGMRMTTIFKICLLPHSLAFVGEHCLYLFILVHAVLDVYVSTRGHKMCI
jgi:hypothetical protein